MGITPASAIWHQRQAVADSRDRLSKLSIAVDWQNDLALYQWAQWLAMALEFKPDLIIELGRFMGNSTCVFTEAANQLGNCQVVSLCLSDNWQTTITDRVARVVPPGWFRPLDAQIGDILAVDVPALIKDKRRILVLWDAHGFEIAGFVLGHLLPLIRHHDHLVIMHDISDARYVGEASRDYNGRGLWQGGHAGDERMVLGHLHTAVPQTISILDFTSRNRLALYSSDHSYHTELTKDQVVALRAQLGDEFFQINGHWFWFTLNDKNDTDTIYFPKFPPPASHSVESDSAASQAEIAHLRAIIAAMESSKFWQLRTAWFRLKQALKGGRDR